MKKSFELKVIFDWLENFFGENMKKIIFLLFFILSIFCVYIWYSYAYNHQWSVNREAEYLKTKDGGIVFDREKLEDVAEKERERADAYQKTIGVEVDIFRLN
jgi:uncharacterized protein YxeA